MNVAASPCTFSKKNYPIMYLDQNPHQTVTLFECVGLSMYGCGFSVPQMRQFCLFTYPTRLKWASSENMIFFFAKIGIFYNRPITMAIDCNGLSLHIFEEKSANYASGPKSAPNSNSFWLRQLFNAQMRQLCLFTYTPKSKWFSSEKMISFFCQNRHLL